MKNCEICNGDTGIRKNLCGKCYAKNWRKNNPKKIELYRERTKEKRNKQSNEYRKKNPKRIKELGKIHYERKKEDRKKYQRDYKKENPEKVRKSQNNYIKNNPEKIKSFYDNRMFGGLRSKILKRDNYECTKCGLTQQEHFKIHKCDIIVHHKDFNGWGKKNPNNTLGNLQTLCKKCHSSIHGKIKGGFAINFK